MQTSEHLQPLKKWAFLLFFVYLALVFLCFRDALEYYFAKEDFYVLDVGGMNRFSREINPVFIVFRPLAIYGYFAAGRLVFGMNPQLWHMANLVLHALAGALVYVFAVRITANHKLGFFAGLLYLVNLTNFHAVYWVTIAMQTLALIAALAVWLFYLSASESGKTSAKVLCVFFFAAALLVNEVNIVIPPLLAAYRWICRRETIFERRSFRLDIWLWIVLAVYAAVRLTGYWLSRDAMFTGVYETPSNWDVLRNMVAMVTMIVDPLYLLSMVLVSKGVISGIHGLLWNYATALLLVAAGIAVSYIRKKRRGRTPADLGERGRILLFGLTWIAVSLLPSSAISPPVPWRTNFALVGYCLALAGLLAGIARRRHLTVALTAILLLWGWWGMGQIRKCDDPTIEFDRYLDNRMGLPIQIHRAQRICRNITDDINMYLEMFPQIGELRTPSLATSREFYHATFAGQQFNVVLPEHVKYLYASEKSSPGKWLMVLTYSEEDSRLHIRSIFPPERG